jgi:penicillin-binding protein 1C
LVVALDPDIPPSRQRIRLSAQGARQARWQLDGKLLTGAVDQRGHDWAPWPGSHTLALLGADGAVLDEVRFEVRGAVVRGRQK